MAVLLAPTIFAAEFTDYLLLDRTWLDGERFHAKSSYLTAMPPGPTREGERVPARKTKFKIPFPPGLLEASARGDTPVAISRMA